jgi:glc operon protein GlcG
MAGQGLGRRLMLIAEIADATLKQAERYGLDVAIVAVDRGGRDVLAYRTDLTAYNALEPARRKAVTAAAMGMPTSTLVAMTMPDPIAQRALAASPDMLAVPGGFPIVLDNICIGGIGVSGGHYTDDHRLLARVMVQYGVPPAAMPPPPAPPMRPSAEPMFPDLPPGPGSPPQGPRR